MVEVFWSILGVFIDRKKGGRQMKFKICSSTLFVFLRSATALSAQTTAIDFNQEKAGEAPSGFSTALTGKGRPGMWAVMKDDSSSAQGNVLAQTDSDPT